jgi:zinc transporter ZupT
LPNQAKALNVAMIVGLIILILAFLGITVVSRSQVEGFLRVILPVLEWIKTLIES